VADGRQQPHGRARLRPDARKRGAIIAALLVAGCSSTPQPDPRDLATSLRGIETGRYSWDVSYPGNHLAGSLDLPDHRAQWTNTRDGQVRVIGTDFYEIGVQNPDTWKHLDLSHEKPTTIDPATLAGPDVAGIEALTRAMTATSPDGDLIHGTLTLSKMGRPPIELNALINWWDAGPIPATAELDREGRLIRLTADLPKVGLSGQPGPLTVVLSNYGATSQVAKPSPVQEGWA
jgi:hypothetical protein